MKKNTYDEMDEFEAAMNSSEEKNRKRMAKIKETRHDEEDDYPDDEPTALKQTKTGKREENADTQTEELTDEEKEARLARYEAERKRFKTFVKKTERKLRTLRILNIICILLLLAAVLFIVAIASKEKDSEEAFFSNAVVTTEPQSYRLTDKLDEVVSSFNDDNFTASIGEFNGYEYLVLSTTIDGDEIMLCYQNEFPDSELSDSISKSFICKNGNIIILNDKYDITKPDDLIPLVVGIDGGDKGLLYVTYNEEGNMPEVLKLFNVTDMASCGSINLSTTFRYYFYAVCADDDNKYLQITNGDDTYTYAVSDTSYISVNNNGTSCISFDKDFEYSFNDSGIDFKAYVSVGASDYIGEYYGSISFTDSGFNMSEQTFAAYVPFTYEDPDSDGIITPLSEPLAQRIIISGKKSGKYALPYYTNIELSDIDYSLITEDESGIRTLMDGDEIKSSFGIDVSKYQGSVDWKKAAEFGVEYAFVRVAYRGYSEGKIVLDDYADSNITNATAAGMAVGTYIFSQAVNTDEAIEEADTVIDKLQSLGINEGTIVFDTEYYDEPSDARANLINRAERTEITKAFCEEVKAAGYTPMIYANTRWLLLGIDMDELSEYDFWYAYYGDTPILPYKFAIWQYSSTGTVSGVEGDVDLNIVFPN